MLPLAKAKQYEDGLMVAKYRFSVGSRIVNSDFYLTINVIDRLIFGKSCMHEIDLKIYD